MSTIMLIKEAISALKDRSGSSTIAINKYLETEKKVRGIFAEISRLFRLTVIVIELFSHPNRNGTFSDVKISTSARS
jgi:hypothetical protein